MILTGKRNGNGMVKKSVVDLQTNDDVDALEAREESQF